MFDTSRTELATLDTTLELLLHRACEHTAQAEQLALDATRLLSVRPEQLGVVSPQPFYRRLWVAFSGQPTGPTPDEQRLYAMQKLGWRYLQMLNSGNVWEWTASAYLAEYDDSETDSTNDANASRAIRGGSWGNGPAQARVAYRGRYVPAERGNNLGFRLAQD